MSNIARTANMYTWVGTRDPACTFSGSPEGEIAPRLMPVHAVWRHLYMSPPAPVSESR